MIQLVYASRPFGFDAVTLSNIMNKARPRNAREDITGALICRRDIYLQMLEGPEEAIEAAYSRIEQDDRHVEVQRLLSHSVSERLFPAWAMRDDPARSWMWTEAEVLKGAATNATETELLAVFSRLAEEEPIERPA